VGQVDGPTQEQHVVTVVEVDFGKPAVVGAVDVSFFEAAIVTGFNPAVGIHVDPPVTAIIFKQTGEDNPFARLNGYNSFHAQLLNHLRSGKIAKVSSKGPLHHGSVLGRHNNILCFYLYLIYLQENRSTFFQVRSALPRKK
jgi:hypothetical protein